MAMTALEWTFWSSLLLGLYPYAVYPTIARGIGAVMRRRVARNEGILPAVTIITAARNEASVIEMTLRNKLDADYPVDLLDIIVVSDESEDGTDEIVERLSTEFSGRVRLLRQQPRQGKTAALNLAVPQARGEIIVFGDANSMYQAQALRRLVRNFADPTVGYVTGKMVYVNKDGSLVGDGCTAYMRLENRLRASETDMGSVVGVDGGIDAARKRLYRGMRADQLPDFVLPLDVVEQGARVVYEPDALLTEEALEDADSEFRMRVRVTLRALWALWHKRALFNPLRFGVFSFQLLSHKLLRYLSFAPLSIAFVANLLLIPRGGAYPFIAAGQVLVLALAWMGWRSARATSGSTLQRLSLYFVLVNLASATATARFLRGEKVVMWQPRVG